MLQLTNSCFWCLIISAALGCVSPSEQEKIIGGFGDPPSNFGEEFDNAIVGVTTKGTVQNAGQTVQDKYGCTGTFAWAGSPKKTEWVITARHCVIPPGKTDECVDRSNFVCGPAVVSDNPNCVADATDIDVVLGKDVNDAGAKSLKVDKIVPYPKQDIVALHVKGADESGVSISPIEVSASPVPHGTNQVVVAGHGPGAENDKVFGVKRYATFPLLDFENKHLTLAMDYPNKGLGDGSWYRIVEGDSGGPWMAFGEQGTFKIFAVTSGTWFSVPTAPNYGAMPCEDEVRESVYRRAEIVYDPRRFDVEIGGGAATSATAFAEWFKDVTNRK